MQDGPGAAHGLLLSLGEPTHRTAPQGARLPHAVAGQQSGGAKKIVTFRWEAMHLLCHSLSSQNLTVSGKILVLRLHLLFGEMQENESLSNRNRLGLEMSW